MVKDAQVKGLFYDDGTSDVVALEHDPATGFMSGQSVLCGPEMKCLTQLEVWIEGDDDPEITYDEVHSTCIEPGQRKIVNIACTVDDMLDPDPDDDLFHVLDGEYSGIGGIATYHFRARSYDPEAGIRLSTDPAGQFFNAYSYVGGNPICLTDPTGELAPLAAAFIEGAMFTYAASMGFHALLCLEGAITGEIHYIDVNQLFASTLAGGFFGWGGVVGWWERILRVRWCALDSIQLSVLPSLM